MIDKRSADEVRAIWRAIKTQHATPRPPSGNISNKANALRYTSGAHHKNPENPGKIKKSQIYWAAYRAGQLAKRDTGMEYKYPAWLGARKKITKRRQWIPAEHNKPKAKS